MITEGDLVLPGGEVLERGTLLINQGIIQDVLEKPPASLLLSNLDVSVVDASGHWITPGLIDQHLHGGFGIDFNQSTVEEIHHLLGLLPQYGITSIIPTVMTAPKLDMIASLSKLEEVIHTNLATEAHIVGIHIEGPFLNPDYKGAHPIEDLLEPSMENLEGLLSPNLKRITLAPELNGAIQTIERLTRDGIACSIGHSGADFIVANQAIHAGARCATHLFNAMSRMDHRNPGIAMAALLGDSLYVELITDGKHLSPVTLEMTLRCKPFDKTILISDCNALTGLPAGASMQFGKQTVTIQPSGALNEEGKLAGSTTLITDCVRNMVNWGLVTFPQAVQMATLHPATHLKEEAHIGQLAQGAVADVLLWDQQTLNINHVFLAGEPLQPLQEEHIQYY